MNILSTTLRNILLLGPLSGMASGMASGAVFFTTWNSGFDNSGIVPDGNPLGWSDTRVITGLAGASITDITVSLSVTGGYNGDLYVYLQHDSGISILLNRPGRTATDAFGYADSGFNVTFNDSAPNGDSHVNFTGSSILAGTPWQPDGRATDPAIVVDTNPGTDLLSSFDGFTPTGDWTLFVADMSGGDTSNSQVTSWGLELTAVPEPCEVTALALLIGSSLFLRTRPRQRKVGS